MAVSFKYRNLVKLVYATKNEKSVETSKDFDYFYCCDYEPFISVIEEGAKPIVVVKGKIETNDNLNFSIGDYVRIYEKDYRIISIAQKDDDNQKRLISIPKKITILELYANG